MPPSHSRATPANAKLDTFDQKWRKLCIHDDILTLALAGEVDATHPEVFLRCTPNYAADRAEILHSLWGILCATFDKEKLTGSCQVTEL